MLSRTVWLRSSEKEQLVPKGERNGRTEEGGGSSLSSLASWQPSLGIGKLGELGSSVRSGLGMEKPREPEGRCARAVHACTSLTYRQRLLGFGVCFMFGALLSVSALNSLPGLLLGNPAPFAFKCDPPTAQ
jgi:hypothetical protein